jgi:hypothetical protein
LGSHKLPVRYLKLADQTSVAIKLIVLLTIAFSWYLITGAKYVDLEAIQQQDDALSTPLDNNQQITQSFVSKIMGLCTIRIELSSIANTLPDTFRHSIFLILYDDKHNLIAKKDFLISALNEYYEINFSFHPQYDSYNKQYFLVVNTDAPPDSIFVHGSYFDSYKNGLLQVNHLATDHDLAFTTYAKPLPVWLLNRSLSHHERPFFLLIFSLWCFVLGFPFYCLLNTKAESSKEIVIKSICLGISIPPLLLYVLSAFKIALTGTYLLILVLLVIGSSLYCFFTKRFALAPDIERRESAIFGLILGIAFFSRLLQINDILVPNWVDGMAHEEILERIIDKGSLPLNLLYHLGFHSNVIVLYRLLDRPIQEITLLYGQWLSIVSGLSFYLLAKRLLGNSDSALFATSFYWFLSPFPAYLVEWSRYPILQAITILPLVLLTFFDHKATKEKGISILFAVGLVLSHYGIGLTLGLIILLSSVWRAVRSRTTQDKKDYAKFNFVSISILLLTVLALVISVEANKEAVQQAIERFAWRATLVEIVKVIQLTFMHGGWIIWGVGVLGIIMSFLNKSANVILSVQLGIAYLAFSTIQEYVFGTPIFGMINNLILMPIALCLLSGFLFNILSHVTKTRYKLWVFACILLLSLAGGYNIAGIINPSTVLFTKADADAMLWISSNTHPDSRFLITSFDWHNGLYEPADGGGWIPYLAKRKTTYLGRNLDVAELNRLILNRKIDYVYIGSSGDEIKALLINNSHVRIVYQNNNIEILKIVTQ